MNVIKRYEHATKMIEPIPKDSNATFKPNFFSRNVLDVRNDSIYPNDVKMVLKVINNPRAMKKYGNADISYINPPGVGNP